MVSSPGGSTSVSQRFVSFLMDAEDVLQCEICFRPFDSQERPPKLLPCGHNFCQACLGKLCLTQQFLFNRCIKCPTCRTECPNERAIKAPTNYDLCKMLESVKKGEDVNVTVIHVVDKSLDSGCSKMNIAVASSPVAQKASITKRSKRGVGTSKAVVLDPVYESAPEKCDGPRKVENINRCVDCKRRMSLNNRCKTTRFCQKCFGNEKVLRLSCLECCVNKHNGHRLISVDDLEYDHFKLIGELRELCKKTKIVCKSFDDGFKALESESNMILETSSLNQAKKTLMEESERCIAKSLSKLEDRFMTPLPPAVVKKIRQKEFGYFSKLQKLNSLLEKCQQTVQSRQERQFNILNINSTKSTFSSSGASQSSVSTSKFDITATYNSLSTVMALLKEAVSRCSVIKKILAVIVDEKMTEQTKIDALKQCILILNDILDKSTLPENLMILQDAYLNCYHSIHFLSKNATNENERKEVWAMIQISLTELLRIASVYFPSNSADRVDIVGDLAFLCHLYSDVCDHATMTLCVIEAARARVACEQVESTTERERMTIQLKLIDEHLLECQRVQKLKELRSNTKTKTPGRCKRFKQWLKSTVISSKTVSAI